MVHDLYVAAQAVRGEELVRLEAWKSRNTDGFPDLSRARMTWADGRVIAPLFRRCWMLTSDLLIHRN